MKKVFLILTLLTSFAYAQNPTGVPTQITGRWLGGKGYVSSDSGFFSKFRDTANKPLSGYWDIRWMDTVPYLWNGGKYTSLKSSGSSPSSVQVRDSLSYVNLAKFGGGPSVDNGAVINSLIASGNKSIYIPAGVYPITTKIAQADSIQIWGDGRRTRLTISSADTIIKLGRFSNVYDISFEGTSNASQVGVALDSVNRSKVIGCFFLNLGSGIYARANGSESTNFVYGNDISYCFGQGNKRGIFLDTRAEYFRIENVNFSRGDTGVANYGGNNNIVNSSFNLNVVGGRFFGGANNAHSSIVSTQFNHNTSKSIDVNGVTLGLDFSSCQAFYGSIDVVSSTRVTFLNLQVELTNADSIRWTSNTAGYFGISNQVIPAAAKWVITGTAPMIIAFGGANSGYTINQGGGSPIYSFTFQSGVASYSGTSVQQHFFGQPIVGMTGSYNSNRDLGVGSIDVRYTGSGTYADLVQMFSSGTNVTGILGVINTAGGYSARFHKLGNVWFGGRTATNTVPTASIHIVAGTATANTGPLKFTAGTNLTTPEAGAVEFDGTNYFVTSSTTRYTLAKTLTNTASLDFPSVIAGGTEVLTIAVTGAADGDIATVGVPIASQTTGLIWRAYVSATNTVTVSVTNTTAAPVEPATATFRVSVLKY